MTPEQVTRRRAIEALRSGVPSWDAVAALGAGQPAAEERFAGLLEKGSGGLLVGAGFGAGKSHLLMDFAATALDAGCAVSTVVVSKETPLHDPAKVFGAAVASLVGPGRVGGVLADAAASLEPDSARYRELMLAVRALDERFAATLHLQSAMLAVPEDLDVLVRFWAGEPLRMPDLRRLLKAAGAAGMFSFGPVPARELAWQRVAFCSLLLRAAGYAGWVVLFDEVELIGRYSVLQRGRSYAELWRWLSGPAVSVLAVTDDFAAAVLTDKEDRTRVPVRLRDKQTPEWDEVAGLAEKGIRALERDVLLLEQPSSADLDRAYATLKALHGAAFDWSPPDIPGLERLGATRMRQYVRAWINGWDLVRLDPSYVPSAEVVQAFEVSYDEDETLS